MYMVYPLRVVLVIVPEAFTLRERKLARDANASGSLCCSDFATSRHNAAGSDGND